MFTRIVLKVVWNPLNIFNKYEHNLYTKLHLTLKALFQICYYQSLGTGSKRKFKILLIEAYF